MFRNRLLDQVCRCALVAAIALFTVAAQATNAIFTVDTTLDLPDADTSDGMCLTSANTCSLRAAVMQANQLTNDDAILINVPAGTYVLTRPPTGSNDAASGDLNLTAPQPSPASQAILIVGAAAATTIIDANHTDRAFDVAFGRTAFIGLLTIRNGAENNLPGDHYGGAIGNDGNLTVSNCVIEDNAADVGGGIWSDGTISVYSSTLRFNSARDNGGGFGTQVGTESVISDSSIYGNFAVRGGGIFVYYNAVGFEQLKIIDSTISANTADALGGGLYADGLVTAYNATIADNNANNNGPNSGEGGGIYVFDSDPRVTLSNTIVAGNTVVGFFPNDCDGGGRFTSYSGNLFGTVVGAPLCVVDGTQPGAITLSTLGPLQDNGGPTLTHALLPGSEAIDIGDSFGCPGADGFPLLRDQRDSIRPVGARCDAGAFEYGSFPGDDIFLSGFDFVP